MPKPLAQFLAIAGLACKDLLRQPVCLLVVLVASLLIVFVPQLVAHQIGQQASLARDSALAFQLLFGVVLAGYAACSTLHSECAAGTLLTVFSRPVSRATFFLSKVTGVALLVSLFVCTSTAASLVSICLVPPSLETHRPGLMAATLAIPVTLAVAALLNFRQGHSFPASAQCLLPFALLLAALFGGSRAPDGAAVPFASLLDWRIVPAGLMGGMALLVLSCIALALATRLKPAPAVSLLIVIFFAGLISNHLVSLCPPVPTLHFVLRALLPDIQSFWPADELAMNGAIGAARLLWGGAYALAYGAGAASLGILCFRRREF